jgi:hypothetical protein
MERSCGLLSIELGRMLGLEYQSGVNRRHHVFFVRVCRVTMYSVL